MSKPRKHAELIKAWAEGADIERKEPDGTWCSVPFPRWVSTFEYRVAPKPLRVVERLGYTGRYGMAFSSDLWAGPGCDVAFTIDTDTKKVLAVELIEEQA